MIANLRSDATKRIEQILNARGSQYSRYVASVQNVRQLPKPVREAIVEALADELGEKGLREDSEPTEYGLELENLIDACGLTNDR